MKPLFTALLTLFLAASCSEPEINQRSFCFWETSLSLADDAALMDSLKVDHFYLRYFDLDWSEAHGEAIPQGRLRTGEGILHMPQSFTPSVFITNRVFENTSPEKVSKLAEKTVLLIRKITREMETTWLDNRASELYDTQHPNEKQTLDKWKEYRKEAEENEAPLFHARWPEVLIDCDWTHGTEKLYFQFLREVRSGLKDKQVSATIRLWQYQDRKTTGIPPVDAGLLMCYGIVSPAEIGLKNAIGNDEYIRPYLVADQYPLPLDVALPIFSWVTVFRDGQFKGILTEVSPEAIDNDTTTWLKRPMLRYTLRRDTLLGSFYARAGDEVKVSTLSPGELRQLWKRVKSHDLPHEGRRLTFFSWQPKNISRYGVSFINLLYDQ